MSFCGWSGLPGKHIDMRAGQYHHVKTDRGIERLRPTSAGGGDARFRSDDPDDYRIVIVPWEEWAERITDLRTDADVEAWRLDSKHR